MAQIGTTFASMNRTGKTDAKKGPDIDYNAFKDVFDRETESHFNKLVDGFCWYGNN